MKMSERREKCAAAIVMLVLMLVGLCTVNHYTGSYDESVEQMILASNMKEYALRLSGIGWDWDVWLQSDVQPISQSIEKDHGISGYYLYGMLFPLLENQEGLRYTLWNVFTWLWFMLGVWSLYALARRLGANRLYACLSSLILYLSPRFFADAHLNNKDMVLLSLFLAVLWLGARFVEHQSLKRGMMFSIVGAIAANTKIVGVIPWGLMWLAAGIRCLSDGKEKRRSLWMLLGSAIAFLGFYFILTPAMWDDPIGFFAYLLQNAAAFSRWSGRIFFRGASFELPENPLPFYYLIYMIIVTVPLYTLPLAAVGQLRTIRDLMRRPRQYVCSYQGLLLLAVSACWILPVLGFCIVRPLVYNGWRHFYFAFAGLAVMAAYGIISLIEFSRHKPMMRKCFTAVLCVCFVISAAGMIVNHPRQSAYYNPIAGKAEMETDYWNSCGSYALEKLYRSEERNQDLPLEVGCWFLDIQNARFKLPEEIKACLTTTTEADAPYLYYIENYVQVYNVPDPEGYHVLFEVDSYGRLIGTMYERDT